MPWNKGEKPTEQDITELDKSVLTLDWDEICKAIYGNIDAALEALSSKNIIDETLD